MKHYYCNVFFFDVSTVDFPDYQVVGRVVSKSNPRFHRRAFSTGIFFRFNTFVRSVMRSLVRDLPMWVGLGNELIYNALAIVNDPAVMSEFSSGTSGMRTILTRH